MYFSQLINHILKKKIVISLVVLTTFVALRYIKYFFAYVVFGKETWNEMDVELASSISIYTQIFIALLVTVLLFKKLPFKYLGLKKDILKGLLAGFLFTLPMFIGYGYQANFQFDISLSSIHLNMVIAGFFEEFMFRGFVFGILFYYGGLGFVSAILIPSLFFGLGHLYQAESLTDSISIFIFTALSSAGFAWFYISWGSLWMVIFLHGFMDLAWSMFKIEANATGDLYSNIFRFITLGLVIFFSIRKVRKDKNFSLKGKLWLNNYESN